MAKKTKVDAAFTGTTRIGLAIDKSASMAPMRDEVISGVNKWREETLKVPGTYSATITLFDTAITTPVKDVDLKTLADLDRARYAPSGMTALNDAIASTIRAMNKKVKATDRALIVIVTDGQENASREFSNFERGAERIKTMIAEHEARGNWTFAYLSASPSAFADAAGYGIDRGNTIAYEATNWGTQSAYSTLARSTTAFASMGASASDSFFGDQDHVDGEVPAKIDRTWVNTTPNG